MISCRNISLHYGEREVFSNFSLDIAAHSITAIIGANGCGKSTLLAALAGDLKPSAGEISLQGAPIHQYSIRELASIRSVAQQSHQYWMAYKTIDILKLGHEDISDERFSKIIAQLGMDSFLHQSVTTLSGGELQRIEIARAFLRELPLVLLDEPFASQDLVSIASLQEFFIAEVKTGRTIVLVAHQRREELTWCNQIVEIGAR
ncbi:FepC ABC-type cobalamin/Fe3+-siderophores transport systems, ATPase components [Candidatus Nanopelagicaceae bacterium]